jgi:hypothetical protein
MSTGPAKKLIDDMWVNNVHILIMYTKGKAR